MVVPPGTTMQVHQAAGLSLNLVDLALVLAK
jgi:hypothetical protein